MEESIFSSILSIEKGNYSGQGVGLIYE